MRGYLWKTGEAHLASPQPLKGSWVAGSDQALPGARWMNNKKYCGKRSSTLLSSLKKKRRRNKQDVRVTYLREIAKADFTQFLEYFSVADFSSSFWGVNERWSEEVVS